MLQQELSQLIKLRRSDEDDESALFALIEQVTSDDGLGRVKLLADYPTLSDEQNPDGLIKLVISEHTLMMHNTSPREAKFVAVVRYHHIKQLPQQSDEEFVEKFKLARSNMRTLQCKYDPDEEDEALQFLMNLDPPRHGEFMRDVINRERAEAGKGIPNSVDEVVDLARRFISTPKTSAQVSSALVYQTQSKPNLAPNQAKKPCANCDELGHWARQCPKPDRRKDETRVMVTETEQTEQLDETAWNDCHPVFGYSYTMRVVNAFNAMRGNERVFTIDSFATESFVFSEALLDDCTDDETMVHGIHGQQKVGRRGSLLCLGPAIVAPGGGVNGVSLSQVEDRFPVAYLQGVSFTVTVAEDYKLVFNHVAGTGCYSCVFTDVVVKKLKEIASRSSYIMVSTVAERIALYTKREVSRAEEARVMMRKLYHPSDVGLARTINGGVMTNCDVTGKDVVLASDIWGKDVPSLKGKTKEKGPSEDMRMFVPVMQRKE